MFPHFVTQPLCCCLLFEGQGLLLSFFFRFPPKLLRRIEERIEEHVSIPEILKRYGLPALFFHFLVWVSTLTGCYLFLSLNTSILELLPAELQQRISACLTDMHAVFESCEVFMPMKQLNI